jgi:hypothetical protein
MGRRGHLGCLLKVCPSRQKVGLYQSIAVRLKKKILEEWRGFVAACAWRQAAACRLRA